MSVTFSRLASLFRAGARLALALCFLAALPRQAFPEDKNSGGETADVEILERARVYRDSSKKIRMFTYGVESFTADSSYGGRRVFVTGDDERVVRRFYDTLLRLTKSETWDMSGGVGGASVVSTEQFLYDGDSIHPARSTLDSETAFSEVEYDAAGRAVVSRAFSVSEKKERVLDSVSTWSYAADGTLVGASFQKMDGKQAAYAHSEVYIPREEKDADRDEEKIPPDREFYENGILRERTVYTSKNSYTTTLYFDDGFSVIERYEGGTKVYEAVEQNGRLMRSQEYGR